jgi:hypothetical protein
MTDTNNDSFGSTVATGPWPGSSQDTGAPGQAGLVGVAPNGRHWNVFYSKPLRPFGGSLQVSIFGAGVRSFFEVTANWRGRQEIGFYNFVLPADRCEGVRTLVERSGFARHAFHGVMQPDTPHASLAFNPSGDDLSEASTFVAPISAPVANAMNAVEELAEEFRKQPFLVIAGSAAWNQPRFRVGEALELTATLRSVGEKPVTFDNPLGSINPDWNNLRMVVAAAKPDDKIDWASEVAHVDIARQDLLTTERRLPKAEPRIELAPGKELQFIMRRKFHMSPGFYKAVITYHGSDDQENVNVIGGALDMDLGRIEVTP